jgi:hypothetical protein
MKTRRIPCRRINIDNHPIPATLYPVHSDFACIPRLLEYGMYRCLTTTTFAAMRVTEPILAALHPMYLIIACIPLLIEYDIGYHLTATFAAVRITGAQVASTNSHPDETNGAGVVVVPKMSCISMTA